MATIISGNSPTTIGDDTTINGDITADNITPGGQIVGYQQGVWTPSFIGPATYSLQGGWFVRVGNLVTAQIIITLDGTNGIDTDGFLTMEGFPYMCSGSIPGVEGTTQQSIINFSYFKDVTNASGDPIFNFTGYVRTALADARFYHIGSTGTLLTSKNSSLTNDSAIRGQASYITDDTTWTPINGATVS